MTAIRKPAGRTLAEFQPLKPAEQKLLAACQQGTEATIAATRPEAKNDDNTVRAAFLRFLALGGDEQAPVHEHGVRLCGAWIEGLLDMEATRVPFDLDIAHCHFDSVPMFHGAKIAGSLNLGGCQLPGLTGDRLTCEGSVFLDEGFTATGEVRLLGAQIGRNFTCSGAKFDGKKGHALAADGMVVAGAFFFRKLLSPVNGVSLAASHVGLLVDDESSWGEHLLLDGFTYDSIAGGAPITDALTRRAWLDKQPKSHAGLNGQGADFRPQPWRHLAKVLREMGHAEDARQVMIAFEHRLHHANLIGQTPPHWGRLRSWLYRKITRGGHWSLWVFTGYGYRPVRLLVWMFGVWLACAMFYWYAALAGVFAPSSPLVFQNPEYAVCAPGSKEAAAMCSITQGAGNWYLCEKLPEEYKGFSPLAYSLDVILPFVDLQQESHWSPLIPTPKGSPLQEWLNWNLKHFTRFILWTEILFGWVASLLLVAVVSGLTKRREE